MANEITVRQSIAVNNGANTRYPQSSDSATFDQTAVGGPTPGYLTIGTSEESEAFSELTNVGWVILHNLDATNYVQWGFSTGVYGGRMEPGEKAGPFRMEPAATLYLLANTAACKVLVYGYED